jgi:hypothetical protein
MVLELVLENALGTASGFAFSVVLPQDLLVALKNDNETILAYVKSLLQSAAPFSFEQTYYFDLMLGLGWKP